MRIVYIYGLWDCRDGRLRYIGKTVNLKARLYRHCVDYNRGKVTHCSTWVKGLLNEGLEPMMEILEECNEETWREAERDWIAKARNFGLDLTNMVDGGLGGAVWGRKLSEEHKKKLSQSLIGRPGPMKGMKHTEEAKLKVSLANMGKRPRLGMKNSLEQNAKIGAANAIALKGRKLDKEHTEKNRLAVVKRWAREGERERQSEKMKKYNRERNYTHSPEIKEKLRELALKQWQRKKESENKGE